MNQSRKAKTKDPQPEDSVAVLTNELKGLYKDQKFSDFTLKCDDVTFPVHRNILSARSPVFDRMFSSDMREAASSEVVITDLDPSTLGRFLTFLYTGAVGEELQGDSAFNLYYAADKYQVPSLKRKCVDFLSGNASVSNVCDVLCFADRYHDEGLTTAARGFIQKNYNDVLKSGEWKSFMEREALLAVKTLTHIAENNYVCINPQKSELQISEESEESYSSISPPTSPPCFYPVSGGLAAW